MLRRSNRLSAAARRRTPDRDGDGALECLQSAAFPPTIRDAMTATAFPLPDDWRDAVLVGRIDLGEGPTPVEVKQGRVFDVSSTAPTVAQLLESWSGVPD